MDLIIACGALDNLRFSGTKKNDWYLEEAVKAMESGKIVWAGKYSAPDYELLVSEGCSLAIENNMIYHKPEVMERLTELDIPCLVEKSGNESNPLGRFEWIKLYGTLFGKEKEAQAFFEGRIEKIRPLLNQNKTDKTAAMFYVTKNGSVNVRTNKDYIAAMIELAGGKYIPDIALKDSDNSSTRNIQIEDFFASAKDADIMVYNAIVDRPIGSIKELLQKNELFADFKAVKNQRVYCLGREFFQTTTGITQFILDMNNILNGNDKNLVYLKKIDQEP
jgi:iron complex transport system substrate-binding protein